MAHPGRPSLDEGAPRAGLPRLDKPAAAPYTPGVSRAFLAAVLLSLPAVFAGAAGEGEPPGRAAGKSRRLLENLPVETRAELRRLYRRYEELVSTRLEAGWKAGLLDESSIAGQGGSERPSRPARLLEDMARARRLEIAGLEETLKRASPDKELPHYSRTRRSIQEKTLELNALRAEAAREKGLCRDWSDAVWHELTLMEPAHWTARDAVRAARPFHTGAVLCAASENGELCLVFDPWPEGRADVFAFDAWDDARPGGRLPRDFMLYGLPEKAP